MEILVRLNDQETVVVVSGDLDGETASVFHQQLVPICEQSNKIVLDMTEVPYLSSAGLRVLLLLYRHVSDQNGELVMVGLSHEIREVLSETGFLSYFVLREPSTVQVAA